MEVALQNIGHTNETAQHKARHVPLGISKIKTGSMRKSSGGAGMCLSGPEIDLYCEIIKGQYVTNELQINCTHNYKM
jgi:hypothetical protein